MSIDRCSPKPDISVIIPHYNQSDALRRCLESVSAQIVADASFEIIVADNGSDADLSGLRCDFPDVQFIEATARGAAHARNAGMAQARGDIFAFIDADCVAAPGWLAAGVNALNDGELVGGEVIVGVKNNASLTAVEAFERVFAFKQRDYILNKGFSVTANLFVSRRIAEAIGHFKNGVSEDFDWCRRARTLGFHLVFNDRAIISHPARRNWEELVRKWDRLVTERWRGFGGHRPAQRVAWAMIAVCIAASAAPHLAVVMASKKISGIHHRLAAAGVLIRIRFWRMRRMLALLAAPTVSALEA